LNRNGSFSFFPEFEGKLPFEHITVPKSFLKNKPHLTDVVDGTNKKIIPVTAQPISNGTYHIFSGLFEPEFLKDMPKEVVYKDLSINKYDCLQKAFSMEDGSFVGSIIMELPDLDIRNILLQIFIAPKGIEIKNILPFEDAFRKNKEINQKCLHDIADEVFLRLNGICHYTHDDFLVVFCIVVNDKPYKNDLKFFFPVERGGWYSKIENLKILPK
jgi:hypothetical protein